MGIRRSGDRSAYWRKMIAAQAKSGLPISHFCKRDGLSEGSFYLWRKKLAAAGEGGGASSRDASRDAGVASPAAGWRSGSGVGHSVSGTGARS